MNSLGWEMIETSSRARSISENTTGVYGGATIYSNTSRLLRKKVTQEESDQIQAIIKEKL